MGGGAVLVCVCVWSVGGWAAVGGWGGSIKTPAVHKP